MVLLQFKLKDYTVETVHSRPNLSLGCFIPVQILLLPYQPFISDMFSLHVLYCSCVQSADSMNTWETGVWVGQ